MDTPLVTQVTPKDHIVLIVDKTDQFGSAMAANIESHATVVLVSEHTSDNASLIHIPFTKRVPEIPVGTYSHIFLFSEQQTEHELLVPFAQKAQEDNAKFVYILPYWLYTPEIVERLSSLCRQSVLVLVGDVFDTKDATSHIGSIFHQAKTHKSIALSELGLETLRPVEKKDALEAILRVGFGLEKEQICLVFSKHPFTTLSVVHTIQKVDPLLRIDFVSKESLYPNPFLPEGLYLLGTEYPVLKKIQDAYTGFEGKSVSNREEKPSPIIVSKKTQTQKGWKLPVIAAGFGMLFLFALPFLWVFLAAGAGGILLESAKTSLEKGDFVKVHQYAQASETFFSWAHMGSQITQEEADIVGQANAMEHFSEEIQTLGQVSQIVEQIGEAGGDFQQVNNSATLTPQATFTNGTIALKNAIVTLQTINQSYLPKSVTQQIQPLQPLLTLIGQTMDVSPALFGMDRPKTYLILFQNNTELRPGGGFIGSYGLVSVNKGKIGNIQIHDVYDADGQLKGHVEPPFAIRRYIPLVHWYLRDSNFSADNVKNAQTEAFFLEQETGVKADGVIAIDLDFVKELIAATGNVYVPEYNQTVTENNFFFLTESHAEKNTFAGSTQKKDFLTALFSALEKKLQSGHVSYLTLGTHIMDAFLEKHVLVAFSDNSIQQLFTVNSMSSALWDPRVTQANTLSDFTAISEANLGVNKDNAFIKRSIDQEVRINPSGTVSGILTIHYNNTSDGTWPGGVYKNYLRVLLPIGAQIANISLNNIPQSQFPAVIDPKVYEAKNFKAPKGLEIEHTQEGGREEYGFLVTVPTKATLDVAVSYSLSQKFDLTQNTSTYDILLFKQPGTEADPYTFALHYPKTLTVIAAPKNVQKSSGQVTIKQPFSTDLDYQFTFAKQ